MPEAALNVEIQLYKNNALVNTFSLVADIYRSDVAAAGKGTGYYGFQYNIDWSEYPAGEYTVRAFAGINTPDTELLDSEMEYYNHGNSVILLGVDCIHSSFGYSHDHLTCLNSTKNVINSNGNYIATVHSGEFTTEQFENWITNPENCILAIRSHGQVNKDALNNVIGTWIELSDNHNYPTVFSVDDLTQLSVSNMKLIVFIGCHTGANNVNDNNLPKVAIDNGAETAIGFNIAVDCAEANKWTTKFFQQLEEGESVYNAAYSALFGHNQNLGFGINNITICGNTANTLF